MLPPVATEYFGTDYLYRAAVGWQSMYVNDPIEAYYPPIYTDLDGAQLDGSAGSYEIRFPAGHLPPVDAFWSITLYDLEKRLMALVPDDAPPLPPAPPPVIGPSKRPRHDPDDTPPRRFDDEPTDGRDDLAPGRRMAPTRPIAGAAR